MQVKSVQFDDLLKRFRLENDRRVRTHRFACLGPSDEVVYRTSKDAHVRCLNGNAILLPAYQAADHIDVGQRRVSVTVKEIQTDVELLGYVRGEALKAAGLEAAWRLSIFCCR